MRVSSYYKLGLRQEELDFVDVDIEKDDPLYIDPRALRLLGTDWGDNCVSLIQDFFQVVIRAIRKSQNEKARLLLAALKEPNETHLGLSRGRSRGHALGPNSSYDVWDALKGSEAIQTGLLEDLEETVLMIEGISFDIISDIATNIIRAPLIEFTQEQAEFYGMEMESLDPGPLWDPSRNEWVQRYAKLPTPNGNKLLLVPKVIVRKKLDFRSDEYFRHYILTFLQEHEISTNSELVRLLKDGTPRVNKKDLMRKYGYGKHISVEITKQHPAILDQYRKDKENKAAPPLDHGELAENLEGITEPNWDGLLHALLDVEPGREGADDYHRSIRALLTPLFHPNLAMPKREVKIHGGRKRIDLTYNNMAVSGFFAWLANNYPVAYLIIECKNYKGDPANPELDQVSSRFSPSRGKVGFLLCRKFEDKELFIQRCRDTANDQRGFVVPFDDDDLQELVAARKAGDTPRIFALLKERFDRLTL